MATEPTPVPRYTVIGMLQTSKLDPTQHAQEVWQVTFTTPQGDPGVVYVPVAGYSAANVDAAITAQLAVMNEVRQLGQ